MSTIIIMNRSQHVMLSCYVPDIKLIATWGTICCAIALDATSRTSVPIGCLCQSNSLTRLEVPTPWIQGHGPIIIPKSLLMLVVEQVTSPVAHFPHCESPFRALVVLSRHQTFCSATLAYSVVSFTFTPCRKRAEVLIPSLPEGP